MKASELAKILNQTPNAEVSISEYNGCLTPTITVKTVKHISKGEFVGDDGGEPKIVDKNKKAKCDILLLSSY